MTDSPDPIDHLLELPPSEFVSARNKLAAALKKTDGAQAAVVKALPKPSPSVWATNQVARRTPEKIATFLDASDALEKAQTARASSDESRRAYQAALAKQREALDRVVNAARDALSQAGLPTNRAVLERVTNDLRWGVLGDETRRVLEEGRLLHDLEPPDFSALVDRIPIVARPPRAARDEIEPPKKSLPEQVVPPPASQERKRADAVRARHASARQNADAAREDVERTRATLDEAEKALAGLRRTLAAAEKTAAEAARAHSVAKDTLAQRNAHVEDLAGALARAEKEDSARR
jgi:hypothetical protein